MPKLASSLGTTPRFASRIDLPTIQPTATGLIMNGKRNATRKNFWARIC